MNNLDKILVLYGAVYIKCLMNKKLVTICMQQYGIQQNESRN